MSDTEDRRLERLARTSDISSENRRDLTKLRLRSRRGHVVLFSRAPAGIRAVRVATRDPAPGDDGGPVPHYTGFAVACLDLADYQRIDPDGRGKLVGLDEPEARTLEAEAGPWSWVENFPSLRGHENPGPNDAVTARGYVVRPAVKATLWHRSLIRWKNGEQAVLYPPEDRPLWVSPETDTIIPPGYSACLPSGYHFDIYALTLIPEDENGLRVALDGAVTFEVGGSLHRQEQRPYRLNEWAGRQIVVMPPSGAEVDGVLVAGDLPGCRVDVAESPIRLRNVELFAFKWKPPARSHDPFWAWFLIHGVLLRAVG